MRRILLVCSMLFVIVYFAAAQQPVADVAAPVSKKEFVQKVSDFDKLLADGDITAANKKFNEITPMIHAELKVVRYKIRDSEDDAEKKSLEVYTTKQRVIYGEIGKLKNDMANNRDVLVSKLNEFAGTIQ